MQELADLIGNAFHGAFHLIDLSLYPVNQALDHFLSPVKKVSRKI